MALFDVREYPGGNCIVSGLEAKDFNQAINIFAGESVTTVRDVKQIGKGSIYDKKYKSFTTIKGDVYNIYHRKGDWTV